MTVMSNATESGISKLNFKMIIMEERVLKWLDVSEMRALKQFIIIRMEK